MNVNDPFESHVLERQTPDVSFITVNVRPVRLFGRTWRDGFIPGRQDMFVFNGVFESEEQFFV